MENQAKLIDESRHRYRLAINMPCELRIQRPPMEDNHFYFSTANGQAHAKAKLMHNIHQLLQPIRRPGKEYYILGIHQ